MARQRKPKKEVQRGTSTRGKKDWDEKKDQKYLKDREFDAERSDNDPRWYSTNPMLLKDAASIPFSWSTGTRITTGFAAKPTFIVPGISTISLMPTFGYSDSTVEAMNIAAFEQYSFVRHANSGSANYDAPDLMLYCMSIASVVSFLQFVKRVYGVANLYSQRNRYLPRFLVESMGVDFDSVIENLADFRYRTNVLIHKVASFAIPANFTLYQRQAFLYSNVYCEGTSVKDQMYLYVPDGFCMYGISRSDVKSGKLYYMPFDPAYANVDPSFTATMPKPTNGKFTTETLMQYGDNLLTTIMRSEDLNIMSGDILKAYGDGGILKFSTLEENYMVVPMFDIGVLEQFKNAKFYQPAIYNNIDGGAFGQQLWSVAARTNVKAAEGVTPYWPSLVSYYTRAEKYGTLRSMVTTQTNVQSTVGLRAQANQLLTTTTAEVTPELVMESSRLIVAASTTDYVSVGSDTVANNYPVMYYGSEIPVWLKFWQIGFDDETGEAQLKSVDINSTYLSGTSDAALTALSYGRYFDFCPEINGAPSRGYFYAFDLDNYAVLTPPDLKRLHEAAILSMLNVSSIARI